MHIYKYICYVNNTCNICANIIYYTCIHSTLYTVQCTMYTVQSTVYIVHCTVYVNIGAFMSATSVCVFGTGYSPLLYAIPWPHYRPQLPLTLL